MQSNDKPARLLTREQAAEFLNIKPQTLAAWASLHRYQIPFVKVGSTVRYRLSDLERWVQSRMVGAEAN